MNERTISRFGARWRKVAALAFLGMMVTGSLVAPVHSAEKQELEMTDLKSVEELKDLFNADKGSPRLLLLFSPT